MVVVQQECGSHPSGLSTGTVRLRRPAHVAAPLLLPLNTAGLGDHQQAAGADLFFRIEYQPSISCRFLHRLQAWEIISKELKKQGISFISTLQVPWPTSPRRCPAAPAFLCPPLRGRGFGLAGVQPGSAGRLSCVGC